MYPQLFFVCIEQNTCAPPAAAGLHPRDGCISVVKSCWNVLLIQTLTPLNLKKTQTNHTKFVLFENNLLACFPVAGGLKCSAYVPADTPWLFVRELDSLAMLCSYWFGGKDV